MTLDVILCNYVVPKCDKLSLKLIFYANSERSDECIDFTMMGGFRWQSEYPWCIIEFKSKHFSTIFKKKNREKQKKSDGKQEFLRKTSFRPNRFSYMLFFLISTYNRFLKPNFKTRSAYNHFLNVLVTLFILILNKNITLTIFMCSNKKKMFILVLSIYSYIFKFLASKKT
ncbi:hypothetical protein AGLY_001812 [Aphis glycines]|uniref:Uncharacterized protein n=1 Tax=Aphis glycines TaxID=307491 RepID=A0A6G0U5A4_APHGL|nr:hypothetical protein AGLY_001812 [Aphis glycines]